jgi:hypothetical protein
MAAGAAGTGASHASDPRTAAGRRSNGSITKMGARSKNQEESMKKLLRYIIGGVLFSVATHIHAASLTGILTINAGTKDWVELDPVNSPGELSMVYVGGSYFAMGANNPNTNSAMLRAGSAGGIVLGTYQNFVTNPDVPHPQGWQGDITGDGIPDGAAGAGYSSLASQADAFMPFNFFGVATHIGMNPISYQAATAMPAPSADVDMTSCIGTVCTLTADFSALEVYWNGSVFQQGPRPSNTGPFVLATGTLDLADNSYSLSWASQIKGGPFSGVPGYWHIEGTLTPVPLPAAAWLFGSGFVALLGLARRRVRV